MKTVFLLFCGLCATTAFGQNIGAASAVLNAEPVPLTVPSHPQHATEKPMLVEQSLLGSNYTYAKGERPLWEVAPKKVEVPLGDVARALRKEHAVAKKSATVVEN
jgi:hypothetical protein